MSDDQEGGGRSARRATVPVRCVIPLRHPMYGMSNILESYDRVADPHPAHRIASFEQRVSVITTFYQRVEIEPLIEAAGFEVREAVAQLPVPSDFRCRPSVSAPRARPIAQVQRRPSTLSSATRFGSRLVAEPGRQVPQNAQRRFRLKVPTNAGSVAQMTAKTGTPATVQWRPPMFCMDGLRQPPISKPYLGMVRFVSEQPLEQLKGAP